jgi:hypothetical protein
MKGIFLNWNRELSIHYEQKEKEKVKAFTAHEISFGFAKSY